jgi:DNA-binding GntR family transcriptional regulator
LETVVARMKKIAKKGSVEEIIEADLNFHRAICELSANHRLPEAWLNISHQLSAFVALKCQLYDEDTPETTMGQHYPVFEAIKKHDGKLAVKQMKKLLPEDK